MHPAAACHSCFAHRAHAAKLVSVLWRPTTPRVRLIQLFRKCTPRALSRVLLEDRVSCGQAVFHGDTFKNDTCPLLCVFGIGSTAYTAARPRQPATRCTKCSGARGMACTDSEAYEDNHVYARSAISRACAEGEQHHETARFCVLPDRVRASGHSAATR